MNELVKQAIELARSGLGTSACLIFVLAAALVYIWFQHQRMKLQGERLELTEERRRIAGEDLVLQMKRLHEEKRDTELPTGPSSKPTVLVVDDEDFVRMICKRVIQDGLSEVSVETASDGFEGLAKIRLKEPAVLVLDICMPVMSGLDVLAELAHMNLNIPIIISSGYAPKGQVESSPRPENSPLIFVPKPYTPDKMISAIKEALRAKRERA